MAFNINPYRLKIDGIDYVRSLRAADNAHKGEAFTWMESMFGELITTSLFYHVAIAIVEREGRGGMRDLTSLPGQWIYANTIDGIGKWSTFPLGRPFWDSLSVARSCGEPPGETLTNEAMGILNYVHKC